MKGSPECSRFPCCCSNFKSQQSWLWYAMKPFHNHFVGSQLHLLPMLESRGSAAGELHTCRSSKLAVIWQVNAHYNHFVRDKYEMQRARSRRCRRHVSQPNSSKMAVIWVVHKAQPFLRMGHRLATDFST